MFSVAYSLHNTGLGHCKFNISARSCKFFPNTWQQRLHEHLLFSWLHLIYNLRLIYNIWILFILKLLIPPVKWWMQVSLFYLTHKTGSRMVLWENSWAGFNKSIIKWTRSWYQLSGSLSLPSNPKRVSLRWTHSVIQDPICHQISLMGDRSRLIFTRFNKTSRGCHVLVNFLSNISWESNWRSLDRDTKLQLQTDFKSDRRFVRVWLQEVKAGPFQEIPWNHHRGHRCQPRGRQEVGGV